jgi:hypothetical protein
MGGASHRWLGALCYLPEKTVQNFMDTLFAILILFSIIGLIVGLIKPTWLKLKSRKQSLLILGGSTILFFILFGITSPDIEPVEEKTAVQNSQPATTSQTVASAQAETKLTAPVTPPKQMTLEEKITQAVNSSLGLTNNTKKPTIVRVKLDKYNSVELKDYGYKSTDDVKGVLITINSSENLTTNLQKATMDSEAVKIFQAIFPLSSQIGDVVIWSQLPVKDQYGNTKDDTAITFAMGRPLFEKMNWSNFNHRDLPTLLNTENRLDDRNGSHELIRF